MTYDIFISCKSEDYESAKLIYNFLRDHNYRVFLADTELRKKGNAEYGKVIDEALDSAAHLILYTSRAEYVTSSYVESEWRIFIEEKRAGRKQGNLISVLDGIEVALLPISLRHFQSFPMERYTEIVDYLPQKAVEESFSTLRNSLSNILSVENLVENIYLDFKKSYSTTLSSDVINQIRLTIAEIIKEIKNSGCEPKRSDFLKVIKDSINSEVVKSDAETNCLLLDIIKKHCTAASEKIGGLLFSSYFSYEYDNISTDLFVTLVPDSVLNILKQSVSESELDVIFAIGISSVGLIAAPLIASLGPISIIAVMLKKIIEKLSASDETITLSEIKEVYRKYEKDPDVVRNLNQTFQKIIDKNDTIKPKITEIVRSFCDDCEAKLMKIGVVPLSI